MNNQGFTGLLHRLINGFFIQRYQRTDIDHFHTPATFFFQTFGNIQAEMRCITIGDNTQITAPTTNTRFPKRNFKIIRDDGSCFYGIIQCFRFNKQRKTTGAYTCTKQSGSIISKGWANNPRSGQSSQSTLQIL